MRLSAVLTCLPLSVCLLTPAVAAAEPAVPTGTYDIRYADGQSIAWQFDPCGPDCTSASSPGSSFVADWRFQRADGRWTYSGPHDIPCPGGGGALPVVMTYSFDAGSLAGIASATSIGEGCGKSAGESLDRPFQLVRTG